MHYNKYHYDQELSYPVSKLCCTLKLPRSKTSEENKSKLNTQSRSPCRVMCRATLYSHCKYLHLLFVKQVKLQKCLYEDIAKFRQKCLLL